MSATTLPGRRTTAGHVIGGCSGCGIGIGLSTSDAGGRDVDVVCPGCALIVRLTMVAGTLTTDVCDGRCMGAIGPACSCTCGGANHGAGWITRILPTYVPVPGQPLRVEMPAAPAEVARRAAVRHARTVADRQARAAAKTAAVAERRAAQIAEHPYLATLMTARFADEGDFVADMRARVDAGDELSPRQLAACERVVSATLARDVRDAERAAADDAARAAGVHVPTGRVTFTGVIVSVKVHTDGYGYHSRTTEKAIVKTGDGWRVWGTLPAAMRPSEYSRDSLQQWRDGLRGQTVTLTAQVEPSKDDPLFGFFKRARVVDAPAAPAPAATPAPAGPLCGRCGFHHAEPCTMPTHTPAPAPTAFLSGWATL